MFKFYLCLCIAIFAVILICPLFSLSSVSNAANLDTKITEQAVVPDNTVKVMLSKNNSVVTVSDFDYVLGSVAAEMPAYYEKEALKAQAVVCYTYAVLMRNNAKTDPDLTLNGAYLSDDRTVQQGYLSKEELQKKWGSKYNEYYKNISEAVEEVTGQVITYNDKPVSPKFHEISAGKTENAEVVWGKPIPYLTTVLSIGDRLSPDYSSTVILKPEAFKNYAKKLNITLTGNPASWLGEIEKSDAGTVENITVGNTTVTGMQMRDAFNLNSLVFSIKYNGNNFTVTTLGKGHNVGMSQYGADYMARQGSKYDEILMHYYKGTKIVTQ